MTGMSTQGGTMGNTGGMLGMLGFGNSAAAIPMSPGVNPMRNRANTGMLQTAMRNQIQGMPKGMLAPDPRPMMQMPIGGNQYIPAGNLASMQAGNMGGVGNMGGMNRMPLGKFSDPMTRKIVT